MARGREIAALHVFAVATAVAVIATAVGGRNGGSARTNHWGADNSAVATVLE